MEEFTLINRKRDRIKIFKPFEDISKPSQTINAMELGKYVPSTVLALKLASIFEIEVSALFKLEQEDWDKEEIIEDW